jgi:hypothetical protein
MRTGGDSFHLGVSLCVDAIPRATLEARTTDTEEDELRFGITPDDKELGQSILGQIGKAHDVNRFARASFAQLLGLADR